MQNSKVIVAINKDPNAPIFEFSDLAVVGDVHAIVPTLIELLPRAQEPSDVDVARPTIPPPFERSDFVGGPTDAADDRIEVGVLVVGAGPAGLACAIRFGQLLEEDPDVAEQLGEVPLAVAREGQAARRAPAVGRGGEPAFAAQAARRQALDDMPSYGAGARRVGLRPHPTTARCRSRRRRRCATAAT